MKKVMKNKLTAVMLSASLFAMTTTAFAAPLNGDNIIESNPVNASNDIIAEKISENPDMHAMELFMSMYLEELETLRIEAADEKPAEVSAQPAEATVSALTKKTAEKKLSEAKSSKKPAAKPNKKPVQAASGSSIETASGKTVSYSRMLSMKATAYSSDPAENGGWGPVDYFGNPLKLGTVAVDPNVIPLNSKLYIVGYDAAGLPAGGMMATATDIGGAIKGNKIDIFIPGSKQLVSNFGIQNVKVYVLK
jgi:3D (Asp-Asp-Asp) domain-containing protein